MERVVAPVALLGPAREQTWPHGHQSGWPGDYPVPGYGILSGCGRACWQFMWQRFAAFFKRLGLLRELQPRINGSHGSAATKGIAADEGSEGSASREGKLG